MKRSSGLFAAAGRLITLLVLCCLPVPALAWQHGAAELPIEKGDYCIVGYESSDHLQKVFLYKGRRIGVCPTHTHALENQDSLDYYFASLQPRSALYQEDAIQTLSRPIQTGWFYLGIWVAVALLTGALSTGLALRKGLPAVKWFFIGLLGSIFGLLYLLVQPAVSETKLPENMGKIPLTMSPVRCPNCTAENHPSARRCSNCSAELNPQVKSDVSRL